MERANNHAPLLNLDFRITGVNEKTLENVKVTLSDVQTKLKEILPKDAILCGQSLNNDFHALKVKLFFLINYQTIFVRVIYKLTQTLKM